MKRFVLAAACCVLVSATLSHAVIYNWQTGQVIPGTEGITPVPGINLAMWSTSSHNLRYASLSGRDLRAALFNNSWLEYARFSGSNLMGANLGYAVLTGASLSGANLTNVTMSGASLTGADLTDATICGVDLDYATGFGLTKEQLYSTASYQNRDLSRISLRHTNLTAWDFSGQNLTSAYFESANAVGTTFASANLTSSHFNHSTLSGADFSGANLMGTDLYNANLTNANFTNALVNGTYFYQVSGFVKEQLYSTASYRDTDLRGIYLTGNNLSGWDLHSQNMTGASVELANLTNANLAGANLTGVNFQKATVTGTDFSLADLRGATFLNTTGTAIYRNTIRHNGTIWISGTTQGFQLDAGDELLIRNHSMAITANSTWTMAQGSTLKFVLEGGWLTAMDVGTGVTPDLGGTLCLSFAEGVDPTMLLGTQFKLFNWSDRLATGDSFDSIGADWWATWDTSRLYTDGIVTLTAIPEPMTLAMMAIGGLVVRRKK